MKKVIAITLSVLLIFSLLPMAAFAKAPTEEIEAKVFALRDYLYGEKTNFTADEGYDLYLYLITGGDPTNFKDGYIQSVKDAFEQGKMDTADKVAILANNLMWMGEDDKEFTLNDNSKINLTEKMESLGTNVTSPYNYYFVLTRAESEDYINQVKEALESGYTKGSGYDYYGFGTDNTANFGAIETSFLFNDELIADSTEVVESAKTDKGYYYLSDYGTDANGNSTASALYFYALNRDEEKADAAYKLLIDNFAKEDGGFAYAIDGTSDVFASRDALKALAMYLWVDFSDDEPEQEEEITTDDAVEQTEGAKQSTPATGDSLAAVCVAGSAVLALGVTLAIRKKEEK